jgi:hypothetical protein
MTPLHWTHEDYAVVNWPVGEITFEADGFEQRSTGEAVLSDLQVLSPAQRHGA